ncbi:MAG: DUF1350 family protein [Cyanobacteria bacterium J06621_8]
MINFESIPGSNSKVAFHSRPKGVIQFIGGFISGSFPQSNFRSLFQHLYDQGYSLIVYNFPFNPLQFNHWSVAVKILKDLYQVRFEIIKKRFCSTDREQLLEFYADDSNYFWLGYSLGCKYILLLEIISDNYDNFQRRNQILSDCLLEDFIKIKEDIEQADSYRDLAINKISELLGSPYELNYFIKDQPSLLIAPEINNTVEILNQPISLFSFWDFPSREKVQCLIKKSTEIFNLMGLMSFAQDTIARDDVSFLTLQLSNRSFTPFLHQKFEGTHNKLLENDQNLGACINLILQELKQRQLTNTAKAVQCQGSLGCKIN